MADDIDIRIDLDDDPAHVVSIADTRHGRRGGYPTLVLSLDQAVRLHRLLGSTLTAHGVQIDGAGNG